MHQQPDEQLSIFDFGQSIGIHLKETNRWVLKAQLIPWKAMEEKYEQIFPSKTGNVVKPFRLIYKNCAQITSASASAIVTWWVQSNLNHETPTYQSRKNTYEFLRLFIPMKTHLAYSDFCPCFQDSLFEHILKEQGLTCGEDFHQAKYLLYSNLGSRHQAFHGIKIFYSAESILPLWQECDYAIGFMKDNILYPDCYLRLPYWVLAHHKSPQSMFEPVECTPFLLNRPFCSFVNSNPHNTLRNKFYLALSQYKPITSGGSEYNNVGGTIEDKIAFRSNHKFNIAFEDYSSRCYLTEKLFDAFAARTVPIYWGDSSLLEDINPARLINASDFPNIPALIEYIKEVDTNDTLYASYLSQAVFLKGQKTREDYIHDLRQFLNKILTNGKIERK